MIFNVPPDDPAKVIADQPDYFVWAVHQGILTLDIIDYTCIKIAEKYPNKIFIRVKINQGTLFSGLHILEKPGCAFRVKDYKLVLNEYNPMFYNINKQVRQMGNKRNSILQCFCLEDNINRKTIRQIGNQNLYLKNIISADSFLKLTKIHIHKPINILHMFREISPTSVDNPETNFKINNNSTLILKNI